MKLFDAETGEFVLEADEASGPIARMRGLIGRRALEPGRGLLLRGQQVHTFGMRFHIDAVHLSESGEILSVASMAPRRIGRILPRARWVLEVSSGEAERLGLRVGRVLTMER